MLNQEQIEFYQQHGYLKVEALFSESEVHELSSDMVQVIEIGAMKLSVGKGLGGTIT